MANHFTIKIQCKRYVKAYIESNCGTPADLSNLPDLLVEFTSCLAKKPEHREKAPVANWCDNVTVIIPPDVFYRHGWEMNRENTLDFNRRTEQKVKFFMRQYVGFNHSLGLPVAICIREFQERFGYHEEIWSYESIKKDFFRNGKTCEMNVIRDLKAEINKILLYNLSELGTISKKFKKQYCYE